ncbi:copper-binding protein [Methylovorus mays]|uniref:copper-binding protein n=1 Tax=Methylovorus mays TaxID=184077 RepID=UPI001E39F455|nr:copper-binding protein [Methylovorus mays]MCB5205798.1 copper-binding protein [Methylovorus mays]
MSKTGKRVLWTFNLIGMMALPLTVFAHEGVTHDAPATATAEADISATPGEVRKINLEQGTITLRHGDIKNLGMPGMTMVFVAQDKAMLNGLAEGDQVVFRAERLNGVLMVIAIQKQGAASSSSNPAP